MSGHYAEVAKPVEGITGLTGVNHEADLVGRLRSGDSNAIKELFNTYFDRLYSFIYHEVEKDHSVAEDIVQDTFLNAIKSARNFKGNSHVYTWLVGIAHHKIADYYRHLIRERKNTTRSLDNTTTEQPELVDEGVSVDKLVEFTESRLAIEQSLARLPFDYRQVLILKYIEDLPVLDISLVMKRSPKSIEGLLSRARKALREDLGDGHEG